MFSFLIFVFKYNRFIYILLGIEMLSLSLFLDYSFKFYSMVFFYFLCFVIISSVTGLVILFSYIKSYSYDKSFLYFLE
uniref:NADH dehydrogenase subunit 4L n=1 Tax=Metathelazia capsulata TaxID=2964486 RepID=UPI002E75FF02|nr:NADH dehydrogenase subunit 4L [Metathelazia capsulata]WPS93534.1 NADH dehydrogenase subunit 4L [Metathelazia capsulata]